MRRNVLSKNDSIIEIHIHTIKVYCKTLDAANEDLLMEEQILTPSVKYLMLKS